MHLPRPRLRLRTLLIAMAILAMVLGGWTMWKRREYCLERAAFLERLAADDLDLAEELESLWKPYRIQAGHDRAALAGGAVTSVGTTTSQPTTMQFQDGRYAEQYRLHGEDLERRVRQTRDLGLRRADVVARYRHVARYPWLALPREPESGPIHALP